jgi:hypothetical protein
MTSNGKKIRPRSNPWFIPEAQRAQEYQARIDGLTVKLHAAAARDDQPEVERLTRVIAAYGECIRTGVPFHAPRQGGLT